MSFLKNIIVIILLLIFVTACKREETINQPDENFELVSSRNTGKIISPVKYELWRQNKTYNIVWQKFSTASELRIELIKKKQIVFVISNNTQDDGFFEWHIPTNIINSNMYQIKIITLANQNNFIVSDLFSIRDF